MSSSKKQTIGYRYSLGEHLALVHGPVDKCTRLRWDERVAWEGSSTGGRIDVDAANLFGGDKREGGVSGAIDFETGAPAQGRNTYLQAKLGTEIPAFRGVASLVFRQLYLGNNPYLKPMDVRLQRIHVRQDGVEQWYDATAAVPNGCGSVVQLFGYFVNANSLSEGVVISLDGEDWSAAGTGIDNGLGTHAAQGTSFRQMPGGVVWGSILGSPEYSISTDSGETFAGYQYGFSITSDGGWKIFDGTYYYVTRAQNYSQGGTFARSSNLLSWTQFDKLYSNFLVVMFATRSAIYGIGNAGSEFVRQSIDSGETWTLTTVYADPDTQQVPRGNALWRGNAPIECDSSYTIYCMQSQAAGNYERKIYKTGASVSSLTKVYTVPGAATASSPSWARDGLATDNSGGWVACLLDTSETPGPTIFYSRNDGATWTPSATQLRGVYAVISDGFSFVLTFNGGVARSIDGGETWTTYVPSRGAIQYQGVYFWPSSVSYDGADMNPAHIIRECLTDPDWGMGYPEDAIDDASFTAAADQLFAEQMGISILWDRQSTILDFVDEIVRHIDAALFVSRTTGKFVLKLIRGGYNEGTLLVLDESNVERVEKFSRPTFGELINTVTINYEPCS